jgi:hypothetical protein
VALATAMPSRLWAGVTSASSSAIIAAVGAGEAVVDVDALGLDAECHQRVLLGGEVLGVVETRAYPSLSSATCRVSPVRPPYPGIFAVGSDGNAVVSRSRGDGGTRPTTGGVAVGRSATGTGRRLLPSLAASLWRLTTWEQSVLVE